MCLWASSSEFWHTVALINIQPHSDPVLYPCQIGWAKIHHCRVRTVVFTPSNSLVPTPGCHGTSVLPMHREDKMRGSFSRPSHEQDGSRCITKKKKNQVENVLEFLIFVVLWRKQTIEDRWELFQIILLCLIPYNARYKYFINTFSKTPNLGTNLHTFLTWDSQSSLPRCLQWLRILLSDYFEHLGVKDKTQALTCRYIYITIRPFHLSMLWIILIKILPSSVLYRSERSVSSPTRTFSSAASPLLSGLWIWITILHWHDVWVPLWCAELQNLDIISIQSIPFCHTAWEIHLHLSM